VVPAALPRVGGRYGATRGITIGEWLLRSVFPTHDRHTEPHSRQERGWAMTGTTGSLQRVVNGRLVTPERTHHGTVTIENDRIGTVTADTVARPEEGDLDAVDRLVLPGLVDLHGDELERYRSPRPRADVPVERALVDCERANLAAGVTTKFHAVAFEEGGDGRTVEAAREAAEALAAREGLIDERLHARCELAEPASIAAVEAAVDRLDPPLVSLMHHAPGSGQFESRDRFRERYPGADTDTWARRLSASGDQLRGRREALVERLGGDRTLALHDAESPAAVERFVGLGGDVAEFPTTLPAARRANELGLDVAMGAPNVVRGGSLWGNLDARSAADAGLVDVLCSDYRPASLLESAFVDTGEPLADRVHRVTAGPADAAGLADRGRLEPGGRADLVVVDPGPPPAVESVVVGGELVYSVGRSIRR